MAASATAAPDESVTVPEIVAVVTWAYRLLITGAQARKSTIAELTHVERCLLKVLIKFHSLDRD
jgi:hypothetical protein